MTDWERVVGGTDNGTTEQNSVETDGGTTDRKSIEIDDGTDGREPAEAGSDGVNPTEDGADPAGPDEARTTRASEILDGTGGDGTELSPSEAKRLLSILDGAGIDHTNADSVEAEGGATDAVGPRRPGRGLTDVFLPGRSRRGLTDAPRVVRIVAEAAWRISDYSIRAQIRTTRRMARAVAMSRSSEELLTETLAIAEDELKRAEDELRRQGIDHRSRRQGIDQRSRSHVADRRDTERNRRGDAPQAGRDRTPTDDGTHDRESVGVDEETTDRESLDIDPDAVEAAEPRSALDGAVESLPGLGSSWVRRVRSDVPRIARLVVGTTRRVTEYAVRAQVRSARRMARAAATVESPEELIDETRDLAIEESQRLGLDIDQDLAHRVAGRRDVTAADADEAERLLSERGDQVLRQSADVDYEEPVHPAYAHILEELSVDETRILRLLATEGMQPAVDVRSSGLLPLSSELVAEGLSMVGIEAGCHRPDRTSAYLGNLQRLGLVRIADEPLDDLKRYQVLEAQPDVAEAEEEAGRPSTDYRSIHLTPFGIGFGRLCLSVDVDAEQTVDTTESRDDAPESPDDVPE